MSEITSLEALEALYGQPSQRAKNKVMFELDEYAQTLINHSHFVLFTTSDEQGFTDISPRGGLPGFIKILDNKTLLMPDSSGNNRLDSFKNILANPKVGLLFMVNGIDEVVRLKGVASLHTDETLKSMCPDGNKAPKIVIKIQVESLYFHCAKAVMRAKLWNDTYRVDRKILPSLAQIMKAQQNNPDLVAATQEEMVEYYKSTL